MWKVLGDVFREFFVTALLVGCVMLVISQPNPEKMSVLRYLIADCLAGLVMVLVFKLMEKDWRRAISFGLVGGGTLSLIDLCYWLVRSSS